MADDKNKFRGLLTQALEEWPEEPVVVVYTDDAIDEALVRWSWPERRTTLH